MNRTSTFACATGSKALGRLMGVRQGSLPPTHDCLARRHCSLHGRFKKEQGELYPVLSSRESCAGDAMNPAELARGRGKNVLTSVTAKRLDLGLCRFRVLLFSAQWQ